MNNSSQTSKLIWVGLNIFMIISMIIIGGITRLTDSGLSMTEWHLISGIIPPLNEDDWLVLFDKYKASPEFLLKNYDMQMHEFKKIFFWEYFHRIWGRLIGITYFIPFLIFWIAGKFNSYEKKTYSMLLLFGCFQAFMGWYMVKSGLVEKPDVSHFRLSAHLLIAFIIYSVLLHNFWTSLPTHNEKVAYISSIYDIHLRNIKISIILILLTVSSGAFVSGTNAGWAYNNFPLMGDKFLPPILHENEVLSFNILFNDIGFLQFTHRVLATISLVFILITVVKLLKTNFLKSISYLIMLVTIFVIAQYSLGIIILRLFVPITLGLAHQLGSLILLSTLIITLCEIKKRRAINRPSLN